MDLPVFFPMPEGREFPDPPRCAFCDELGRPLRPEPLESPDLPRLVAGAGLFICERCVRLCIEIFEEDVHVHGGGVRGVRPRRRDGVRVRHSR